MLDYKLIEAFARVIEEGGFRQAAEVLFLTQSAVSQRLSQLESQYGQALLVRSSPPTPTAAGRELLKHYRQVRLLEEGLAAESATSPALIPIGLNGDSLGGWFMDAVRPLLRDGFLLDLRVDDQERTHSYLRNGDVVGCISTESKAIQGCRVTSLGSMVYRLVATPEFAARWFPGGFDAQAALQVPTVLFDHRDRLQYDYFIESLGVLPTRFRSHYIPDADRIVWMIGEGYAYGLVPESRIAGDLSELRLIDLNPSHPHTLNLFWHCWNVESTILSRLTRVLTSIPSSGGDLDGSN